MDKKKLDSTLGKVEKGQVEREGRGRVWVGLTGTLEQNLFNSTERQQTVKKMIANDAQLECGDPQCERRKPTCV